MPADVIQLYYIKWKLFIKPICFFGVSSSRSASLKVNTNIYIHETNQHTVPALCCNSSPPPNKRGYWLSRMVSLKNLREQKNPLKYLLLLLLRTMPRSHCTLDFGRKPYFRRRSVKNNYTQLNTCDSREREREREHSCTLREACKRGGLDWIFDTVEHASF